MKTLSTHEMEIERAEMIVNYFSAIGIVSKKAIIVLTNLVRENEIKDDHYRFYAVFGNRAKKYFLNK
jgi:hypothetical protein